MSDLPDPVQARYDEARARFVSRFRNHNVDTDDAMAFMYAADALRSQQRPPKVVSVVAAVRCRGGKLWVCRRTDDGAHGGLAGMWEYPGGKVEPGESLCDALRREMREEFGVEIEVEPGDWIDTITTEAWGKRYAVHFMECAFLSEPALSCHDAAEWRSVAELSEQQHLPSGTEFNRRLASYASLGHLEPPKASP